MSVPPPLDDATTKATQSPVISPKVHQLRQIYSQQPKFSKEQADELNKKLKFSKDLNNHPTKTDKVNSTVEEKNKCVKIIKTLNHTKELNSNAEILNSNSRENLNTNSSKNNFKENLRELNLANLNSAKICIGSNATYNKMPAIFKKQEMAASLESIIDMEDDNGPKKGVKECVGTARRAFRSGRTRSLEFREKQLKGLLKFLENHRSDIEDAIYKDLRKHRQETNISEIELVANDLRHTLIKLRKWAKPQKPEKRLVNILDGVYIYNEPYGVVLIIGAWNYPVLLTLGPLVGALAGGNTIILKPSELAPNTNKLLSEALVNYLDQECFQIYLGGVPESTELLKEKFDYIFFTGSSKIGQIVYQAAAKYLTPCTLELGGKCPLYLDETADMEKAAKRILWGRLLNSGQTCVAPDYLLCTKEVQERFLVEAQKVLTSFYGEDPSKSESLSRIVTEKHYKRLVEFIRPEHIALGGQVSPQELVIAPTILVDVSPHDPVMEEEIFGPILPIVNIRDTKEAIDFINSREKPLALYVFSKSKKVQNLFLSSTSSGGVSINDTVSHIGTEGLPFGGVGQSGMGSYHGKMGFDTFTHRKGVLLKDFGGLTEMALSIRYPPYSDKKTQLINTILKKRRGISLRFLGKVVIFCLGVGTACGMQYALNLV